MIRALNVNKYKLCEFCTIPPTIVCIHNNIKYWPFLPNMTENHTEKLKLSSIYGNDTHSVTSATLLVTPAMLKFKHLRKIVNTSSNEIILVGSH